jgi:hypothetical protein
MHRAIGAWSHGIIDYLMVIFLAIAPGVIGFAGTRQAMFCYVLAAVQFLLTIVTRFPLGVFKSLRFPLHGAIEAMVGVLLVVLPWLANFSRGTLSRNFFVALGLLFLVIFALTDYRGLRSAGRATVPEAKAP